MARKQDGSEYGWSNPAVRRAWGRADGLADKAVGMQRQHNEADAEYVAGYRDGYYGERQ